MAKKKDFENEFIGNHILFAVLLKKDYLLSVVLKLKTFSILK